MSSRAVMAVGIGQCVNWGVLYYAFAVLLLPVEAELEAERWIVTGAFSLALLVSAIAAPIVGRWSDRDHGARLLQAGGYTAAGLLGVWALFPGVWVLYSVWAGLGLCMAATLYEPAFVVIGRAHEDPAARLRALGVVTLFGGLASTVFLPLTAALVRIGGWRAGVVVLAVLLALSTCVIHAIAFAGSQDVPGDRAIVQAEPAPAGAVDPAPNLSLLLLAFGWTSLSSAAVIANLVPALGERAELAPGRGRGARDRRCFRWNVRSDATSRESPDEARTIVSLTLSPPGRQLRFAGTGIDRMVADAVGVVSVCRDCVLRCRVGIDDARAALPGTRCFRWARAWVHERAARPGAAAGACCRSGSRRMGSDAGQL